ncbi:MAG: hypothetical protein ABIQ65_14425 [Thermoanaerobaculia bacterium]
MRASPGADEAAGFRGGAEREALEGAAGVTPADSARALAQPA